MRHLQSLGHAEAQKAIAAIQSELEKRGKPAAVAVADSHGELIALLRMDGCKLPTIQIVMNKAWTAARTAKPSKDVGQGARDPEKGYDVSYYGDPRILRLRSVEHTS